MLFIFESMRQIFSANSASNFLDSALFCAESILFCEWFSGFSNCEFSSWGGDFDLC